MRTKYLKITHKLGAKYYIRYADDFVVLSQDKEWLESVLKEMKDFLWHKLRLTMHPRKVSVETFSSGVDFLGWVHFPTHMVLRSVTKKRILKRVADTDKEEVLASYLGMLRHGNTNKLSRKIRELDI